MLVAIASLVLLVVLAVAGCSGSDDDSADASSDEPVCEALADLGTAWDIQATGPELGDPDALRALGAEQESAIVGAVDAALGTGEVPGDVAADLEQVRDGGTEYLAAALAWATGDDPGAQPVLPEGVTDAQRRIDEWALERCGAEVWP